MDDKPSQREINQAEWANPDNWSGTWPFNAYFSKRDSRIFVPGLWNNLLSPATLNYGHRYGPLVQASMLVFIFGVWVLMCFGF